MDVHIPNQGNIPPIKFNFSWLPFLLILLIVLAAGTVFYQIQPDEVGVVQRFGKYVRTAEPGLRLKWPFGIETVRHIKVTHVFKQEFGFRTLATGGRSVYAGRDTSSAQGVMRMGRNLGSGNDPYLEESMMLTGDLNVATVEWIVQYTVKDPVQYAFRIREPIETIRNMSEAVMRLVIGDHTINEVLTSGRETVQFEATQKLQELLDSYDAGINIQNVILQDVTPPNEVKPSFNEVNEARQEKEKLINQAWEEYNRVIPRAKGQAEQMLRAAEGYALERVNQAKGDTERFLLTLEAYKKFPEVTRKRLYLEMAAKVLPNLSDKLLLDDSEKGILPLLNLNPSEKGGQKS